MKKTIFLFFSIIFSFYSFSQVHITRDMRVKRLTVIDSMRLGGVWKSAWPSFAGYVPYTGASSDLDLGAQGYLGTHMSLQTSDPSGVATFINQGSSGTGVFIQAGNSSDYSLKLMSYTGSIEELEVNSTAMTVKVPLDLNQNTITGYTAKYNVQTGTTYTLIPADAGKVISINNAGAITLTVPVSLPTGFTCTIVQLGVGQVTITASGTTINNPDAYTKTRKQYATAFITMYASNLFVTGGDMQ